MRNVAIGKIMVSVVEVVDTLTSWNNLVLIGCDVKPGFEIFPSEAVKLMK